ncbi:MAG: creatininase family protein [Thermoprotei archaeon]|nr:creatininase family protein [Thermoprotei archaeon]
MPLDYRELSSFEIRNLASRNDVIAVIPVGSLEQHCRGPLGLDGLIAERIAWESCRALEARNSGLCVILPTIYYAFSPEWGGVEGTLSLKITTFTELVESIISGLRRAGFKRIAFLNGHGGNSSILEAVLREAAGEGYALALVNYWEPLNIKLDHAGPTEKSVAEQLGIKVDMGECEEKASYKSRPRIVSGKVGEPLTIIINQHAPTREHIVEENAKALEELLRIDITKKQTLI